MRVVFAFLLRNYTATGLLCEACKSVLQSLHLHNRLDDYA